MSLFLGWMRWVIKTFHVPFSCGVKRILKPGENGEKKGQRKGKGGGEGDGS